MATSNATYVGNGVTKQFAIPFQYLSRSHVVVTVDDVSTSFMWVAAGIVDLTPAPARGSVVKVARATPTHVSLVDFADGSTLTESDLDTANLQAIFLAQECFDRLQVATGADTYSRAEIDAKDDAVKTLIGCGRTKPLSQSRANDLISFNALAHQLGQNRCHKLHSAHRKSGGQGLAECDFLCSN